MAKRTRGPRSVGAAAAVPTARPRTARRKRPKPEAVPDSSPSRYIARISRKTGKEIPGPIDPEELLVHAWRDKHPLEVTVQFLASRAVQLTVREDRVRAGLKLLNSAARKLAAAGTLLGGEAFGREAKRVLGVVGRDFYFQFREPKRLSDREARERMQALQKDGRAMLRARGRNPRLHVLLTGATGFLGKEIVAQASGDRRIEQVVAVVRPETVRDPKTKEVVKVLSPEQRGALLLKRLHISGARARKFRFVRGDIEQPDLGIAAAELARLETSLSHVVHCAASVSFDDPYEASYRANVLGSRNALAFSRRMQRAPGSRFVNHIAIETSYIHGRKKSSIAQEGALAFPRRFYNNFYELTKAMASVETDRAMIQEGVRVAQLLPSIVIGHSRTGKNRGDTKVVNAPINAFGRSKEAVEKAGPEPLSRLKARLIALAAASFPGDRSAELNLVPVDRVVEGILAALHVPEAIGARIHLATDNRIRSEDMVRITREELGVHVRLVDPTLYRNVTLPIVKTALNVMGQPKLAGALQKLGTIFGAYGEWGQPIHDVGNDVRILGLPLRRPQTDHAFRMLCRHNRYVQEYGRVRDPDEVARRERVWERAMEAIEFKTGREAASIEAGEFRERLVEEIDLGTFRMRSVGRGKV